MSISLTVVIENVSDPIAGTIATVDGAVSRPFRGWLDLATALEAILASERPADHPRP